MPRIPRSNSSSFCDDAMEPTDLTSNDETVGCQGGAARGHRTRTGTPRGKVTTASHHPRRNRVINAACVTCRAWSIGIPPFPAAACMPSSRSKKTPRSPNTTVGWSRRPRPGATSCATCRPNCYVDTSCTEIRALCNAVPLPKLSRGPANDVRRRCRFVRHLLGSNCSAPD